MAYPRTVAARRAARSRPRRSAGRWTPVAIILTGLSLAIPATLFPGLATAATISLTPIADTYVDGASPSASFGTNTKLRTDTSPDVRSYLRFDLSAIGGTITNVTLRVWANSASSYGYQVRPVSDTTWSESITYTSAPAVGGSGVGSLAPFSAGAWTQADVTSLVTGAPGLRSFAMVGETTQAISYASREGGPTTAPQLIVTTSDGTPTPSPTPTSTPSTTPTATPTLPPPGGGTVTRTPVADTYVDGGSPSSSFGTNTKLRTDTSPDIRSYLRFDLSGIGGTVTNVTLRVWATTASSFGYQVRPVSDTSWSESITYTSAPAMGSSSIGSLAPFGAGAWTETNVTSLVTGTLGLRSFAMVGETSQAISYASREGGPTTAPQLVVTTGTPPSPTPVPTPTPPLGHDPIVMAAGDIACGAKSTGASCKQGATSDLLVAGHPDAVLALGDNQYECGQLSDFQARYAPSWGRVKSITRPAAGNHEYTTSQNTSNNCYNLPAGAPGYYTYFGSRASPLDSGCKKSCKGWYSFDLGAWHLIALNSNCTRGVGCTSSAPQLQWLQADLAAHKNKCTLAYWHHPRFSSGQQGDNANMSPAYTMLYNAGVDVVLNGHDHIYERFAPLAPSGSVDNAKGIREFIVGTGGRNHQSILGTHAGSQVRNSTTFGVLRLVLHPTSYDWKFLPVAGSTFTDIGSAACH